MAGPWEVTVAGEHALAIVAIRIGTRPNSTSKRLVYLSFAIGLSSVMRGLFTPKVPGFATVLSGYSCEAPASNCDFDGTHLRVTAKHSSNAPPDLVLNLTFDASRGIWEGTMALNDVVREAQLHRPQRRGGAQAFSLEGSWRAVASESSYCLYAREDANGEPRIWRDWVNEYGVSLFTWEKHAEERRITFQTSDASGTGLHSFTGTLSEDGLSFQGYWDQANERDPSHAIPSVFVWADHQICSGLQ